MSKHLSQPAPRPAGLAPVRELLHLLAAAGGDPKETIRRAGLGHAAAHLARQEEADTLPRADMARLFAECVWALDIHAARQEGRRPLAKSELDLLCHCVITCTTLREAIARSAAFSAMLVPRMANLLLVEQHGMAELRMATCRAVRNGSALVSDLVGLSTYHRLFGWLIGETIPLAEVRLPYPPLLSEACTSWLIAGPLTWRAEENLLRFPAHYLDRPVVRDASELAGLLRYFPFDPEEPQSLQAPLSERLRAVLARTLAAQARLPTCRDLARQFSISPATLKRRLAEEGKGLTALKEAARRERAEHLLQDGTRSVQEIAAHLGFSDAASFRRAFRHWTGLSPTRWRAEAGGGGEPSSIVI